MRLLGWIFLSGGLSATVAYVIGREHGIRDGVHDTLRAFYQERSSIEWHTDPPLTAGTTTNAPVDVTYSGDPDA